MYHKVYIFILTGYTCIFWASQTQKIMIDWQNSNTLSLTHHTFSDIWDLLWTFIMTKTQSTFNMIPSA